jgi:CubicO group peptidase (beta-lactamase class C family)
MRRQQTPTWLISIVLLGSLLVVAAVALFAFRAISAEPLHPSAEALPTVPRSAPPPEWAPAVQKARQLVLAQIAAQSLPGVSVAVGIDGEIVWAEGFGFADLRTGEPVRPDHRFRIGTASTVLTSAAAGLLLEQGRLKLDEEIQTYVPAFPKKQWPVTIGRLMSHTAGIVNDSGDEGPLFSEHCAQPADAFPHFAGEPLLFQPGTQYRYSRFGWIPVSAAIEAAANRPFLTFMREEIFDPLGMRDTVPDPAPDRGGEDFPLFILMRERFGDPHTVRDPNVDPAKEPKRDQVTSYFPRFAADPKHGLHMMRMLDLSCYAGSSVFVSTPSDLVRFGMAMNSGKLLKRATVEVLQTPQRLASGEETGYGLGWYVRTIPFAGKPTRVTGHDGDILGGMVASLLVVPDYGIAVAVASNISYADTSSLAATVAEAFAETR